MRLPSVAEINVFDSLDERHAVKVFLGKDLEQAEAIFRKGLLAILEKLDRYGCDVSIDGDFVVRYRVLLSRLEA